MAKSIVHLETKVTSVFGLLDEEGNLVKKWNVAPNPQLEIDPLMISVLSQENFDAVYLGLYNFREDLRARLKQTEEQEEKQRELDRSLAGEEDIDINVDEEVVV